jgi:predicted lipoprotein with Yx(FWY)xxD motif
MMRHLSLIAAGIAVLGFAASATAADTRGRAAALVEDFERVAMPPGFQVVITELDGPVFADANGRTLYSWPSRRMRNGYTGEPKGTPACYDEKTTENAGLMSPYPPGLVLPDLETRPTCTQAWPPVLASADAKPVGAWSIVARKDGTKQWAYNEHPLYTSFFDQRAGDVLGGTTRTARAAGNYAWRSPIQPPPNIPPGFIVETSAAGRMLLTTGNMSIYTFDKDTPTSSACTGQCEAIFPPMLAPASATVRGEWTTVDRAPGVKQWAFRGKPLYRHAPDVERMSHVGSDVPGWSNVYTQKSPSPPPSFKLQETDAGTVIADARGMTVYTYICADDAMDQLLCDHPNTTQAYRLAICGGGDPAECLRQFPPVLAPKNAQSGSRAWGTMYLDAKTGHRASRDDPDALHVWTFRDRPVYTYAGDKFAGDTDGDSRGEFNGRRQGFNAMFVRDDYFGKAN